MALDNRTRSGIQGGSVTAKSISFTNNIERFVGRSSNSEGRIAATDVIDFDIDLGEIEEPEKFANAVGYIEPERLAWYERAAATICVGFTSIVSGVADVVESVVDGGAYLVAGAMSLVGADDAANSVREFIQTSWVDEANKAFYEGTEIGRNINQASVMAYDSDAAMGIRNTSAKVTKFVAETALTMVPGAGPVLAASFGALSAMGEASENVYVTKGIDNVGLADNVRILASGVGGAIEGYSAGQMGSKIVTSLSGLTPSVVSGAVKNLPSTVKGLAKNAWTGLRNFDFNAAVTAGKETLLSSKTWLRAFGTNAVQVMNVSADWIETGEFKYQDWLAILGNTGKAVLFQTVSQFGAEGISSGFENFQRAEWNERMDSMSDVERSDAWENYFKEMYGGGNVTHESGIGIEGHNGSFVDPEAAAINAMLIHNYEMKEIATGIVQGTQENPITTLIALPSEDRFKVLSNMSPKEIAIAVEHCTPEEYKAIMDTLPTEKKLDVIYAQGELAAQGKYDAFFMNFREHSVEHSNNVRDYAVDLAQRMGIDVNVQEVHFGAQYHDLGMKGGVYRDIDGICRPIDSLGQTEVTLDELEKYIKKKLIGNKDCTVDELNQYMREHYGIENWTGSRDINLIPQDVQDAVYGKRVLDYISDNLGMDPKDLMAQYGVTDWDGDISQIPQEIRDASYRYTVANLCRGNHPLNSAIIILTEGMGPVEERNMVALLAMSHSKSTSGIKDLGSREQWDAAIDRLGNALRDSGVSPEEVTDITDSLRSTLDSNFDNIAREALCIRDGDAMAALALTPNGDTIMQNGTHTHVEYTGRAQLDGYGDTPTPPNLSETELKKATEAAKAAETAGIQDTIYGADDISNQNPLGEITNGFSKRTHAGELNVEFDSDYDGRGYIASATVQDPTRAPFSTLDSIFERTGEVATYGNCTDGRTFEIHFPADMEHTPLGEWYVEEIAKRIAQSSKGTGQSAEFYSSGIKIIFDQ